MNSRLPRSLILSAAALVTFAGPVHAEFMEHDAHVHGEAELNIAVEGDTVLVELHSPSINIVGFEHYPSTESQHQAVDEGAERLKKADRLFLFPYEAACKLEKATVTSEILDEDEEHGHHDDHHDDHHEGEAHHEDEEHHEHAEESMHSEFALSATFKCADMGHLTSVDIRFFEIFPNNEELHAQIILPSGQLSKELTPSATIIDLP